MRVFERDGRNWRPHAAYRHSDPVLFFPAGSTGVAVSQIHAAKALCQSCPVRDACLQFSPATNQEAGIWGGWDEDERRGLRACGVAATGR